MKQVLVTGSAGFIGSHMVNALSTLEGEVAIHTFDIENTEEELRNALHEADIIFHLAGVNNYKNLPALEAGNVVLTRTICDCLRELNRTTPIVFSSTIQVDLDNPYGKSKKATEEVLENYHDQTGADVAVFRLANAFGKWSRPYYNTVVATFCHRIARSEEPEINDPASELNLVYIDDIMKAFLAELSRERTEKKYRIEEVEPVYPITVGKLADTLKSFRESREDLVLPDMNDRFTRCLYATYLSFLDKNDFSYELSQNKDERGVLAEFIKSPHFGQIFVSRTKPNCNPDEPGITRGDHYHHTKIEKFLVLEGRGIIRFRQINSSEIIPYEVDGRDFKVLDIPPGYTHSIENTGKTEMIVLFWASEIYDPENTDSIHLKVMS